MTLKRVSFSAAVVAALLLIPAAQAVTLDLSSPQEGTTVHPGDTVEMTATVTNDTEETDLILLTFTLTVDIPDHPVSVSGEFRLVLEAGESVSESYGIEIPADLQLPGPATVTIEATATGVDSGTEDSDTLTLTVAPERGKRMRDVLSIDLSSPQEGTTVYPGDTVELTATVTNNGEEADLIVVTLTLTVDLPEEPMVFEGQVRFPLEAGESVSETYAVEIPAGLPIEEPVTVTIDATAVGMESGAEASDSLSLTVAPDSGKRDENGIALDLSSPQEGTTVHPGDTVEMTATVTNNGDEADVALITFTLTVELPGEPRVFEGQFRVPLEAGESVSETFAVDIPEDLPLEEAVAVTIEATAVGLESGTEDSDSLSLTVAP